MWREQELSLDEVIAKHPAVSPFVMLKIDLQRRGIVLTAAAQQALNPQTEALYHRGIYDNNKEDRPNGVVLRDGTTVVGGFEPRAFDAIGIDPYTVDYEDGHYYVVDNGRRVDVVYLWSKPVYYDKLTSSGKPMWQVLVARPQRMDINFYQYCDFYKTPGEGCKFCGIAAAYHSAKDEKDAFLNLDELIETVAEAVRQPGRFRMIQMCAGSLLSGEELLDDEIDQYVGLLQRLEKLFEGRVLTQLISAAYSEKQLRRLKEETFLSTYTADIEVTNEELFGWVCAGKARRIGYREWRDRLYKAVEIFGPNSVNTGIVSGVELCKPHGFRSEEEALETLLKESEEFARHGVSIAQTIFRPVPGSFFHNQQPASLDYQVAYAEGLDAQQRKYGLEVYFDDYRTCGNHPNTDLARS
jgi:hypothetical protein